MYVPVPGFEPKSSVFPGECVTHLACTICCVSFMLPELCGKFKMKFMIHFLVISLLRCYKLYHLSFSLVKISEHNFVITFQAGFLLQRMCSSF